MQGLTEAKQVAGHASGVQRGTRAWQTSLNRWESPAMA